MNDSLYSEVRRLNFEDLLWILFIFLSIMNIVANKFQKEYVISNNHYYEGKANNISIYVLTILVFVYVYFFLRNYNMYNNKDNPQNEDLVKVIGSFLFIIGTLYLL